MGSALFAGLPGLVRSTFYHRVGKQAHRMSAIKIVDCKEKHEGIGEDTALLEDVELCQLNPICDELVQVRGDGAIVSL